MRYRVLHPNEAIPILFDRERSPVLSLDTEFEKGIPACRSPLHGLSIAGGTPDTEFVGCFWPYGPGVEEIAPWAWLRDRVLRPLFNDPTRTWVMHPLKVDMQPLRARGITEADFVGGLECTFSMAHICDENLPKDLKLLAKCLFGIETKSYDAVQAEIKAVKKEGKKRLKAALNDVWTLYRDWRKSSKEIEVALDPTWDEFTTMAMRLPPKLKKAEVLDKANEHFEASIIGPSEVEAQALFNKYGAEDAIYTLAIRYWFKDEIPAEHVPFVETERRICHPVVTEMEERGLLIDIPRLGHIYEAMRSAIESTQREVMALWGVGADEVATDDDGEFNPGSTDQVAHRVWVEWGLRPPAWTIQGGEIKPKWVRAKDGHCKVNKDVLNHLARTVSGRYGDAIRKLLELRAHIKMMGTYVEPTLRRAMEDPENRLHAAFWPVGTRTGRFSASDPNVENFPRPTTMPLVPIPHGHRPDMPPPGVVHEKDKDKKDVWRVGSLREVFIAPRGKKIVSADLSQIENRLIAHESQDRAMLALYQGWDCADCKASGTTNEPLHACPNCGAPDGKRDKFHQDQPAIKGFCLGRDIHSATASDPLIGYFEKYGPKDGRNRGKTLNHSATYGMSAQTMARRDGSPVKEAQRGLEGWHGKYPGVRPLQNRCMQLVREQGFVQMFDGHTRRFFAQRLLVRSDNFKSWEWEGVVREAVNVLAQGGTGVIMKRAMLKIRERFLEYAKSDPRYREVYLINQVHDELVYEAPDEIADHVLAVVIWEMEHAAPELTVPVLAEGGCGNNWGEAH